MLSLISPRIKLSQHSLWCDHVATNGPKKSKQMVNEIQRWTCTHSSVPVCAEVLRAKTVYGGCVGLNLHVLPGWNTHLTFGKEALWVVERKRGGAGKGNKMSSYYVEGPQEDIWICPKMEELAMQRPEALDCTRARSSRGHTCRTQDTCRTLSFIFSKLRKLYKATSKGMT